MSSDVGIEFPHVFFAETKRVLPQNLPKRGFVDRHMHRRARRRMAGDAAPGGGKQPPRGLLGQFLADCFVHGVHAEFRQPLSAVVALVIITTANERNGTIEGEKD